MWLTDRVFIQMHSVNKQCYDNLEGACSLLLLTALNKKASQVVLFKLIIHSLFKY